MPVAGGELRRDEALACVRDQGFEKDGLRRDQGHRVAAAASLKAPGGTSGDPVRGAVDGAVETGRIDKGLQQQQRMAEALRPVLNQTTRAKGEHPRAEILPVPSRKDQIAGVRADQVQAVVLDSEIPTDPAVTRGTFQGRRREAQQRDAVAPPPRRVSVHRLTDLRQRAEVVMRLHQALECRFLVRRHGRDDHFHDVHRRSPARLSPEVVLAQSPHCVQIPAHPYENRGLLPYL